MADEKEKFIQKSGKLWFWNRWKNKKVITSKQQLFETNCMLAEREF